MKKLMMIAALTLLTVSALAQNGKAIYNKYSDAVDVSAVYISPAMFRIIGNIPNLSIGDDDVNLTPVIKSLTGFYLIDSDNPSVNASMRKDIDKLLDAGKYELLMEAKDNGETIRMYTIGDESTVTSFIMTVAENGECTFIALEGKISRDKLSEILAAAIDE